MNKEKVLFASILLIPAGLLTMRPSINGWTQIYDFDSGNDHYKVCPDPKKNSDITAQKIKCVNSKINVNGIDITEVSQDGLGQAAANEAGTADSANMQNGNALSDRVNVKRSHVNICVNINLKKQVKIERCEVCLLTVVSQNEIHDIVLKMTYLITLFKNLPKY